MAEASPRDGGATTSEGAPVLPVSAIAPSVVGRLRFHSPAALMQRMTGRLRAAAASVAAASVVVAVARLSG